MIIHKALNPRVDVESRKEGGRGIASIEDSIDALIQRLEDYIEKRGGRLITATRNNTDKTRTNITEMTWKQKWEEKQFYGRSKRQISNFSDEKTWTGLRKGNLKKRNRISSNSSTKQRHKD